MDNPEVKTKVDKYDLDAAIGDLSSVISETATMIQKVKKIKFCYLTQTCDLFTKMDYPTIMMEVCDKEVKDTVPSAKSIRSMNF